MSEMADKIKKYSEELGVAMLTLDSLIQSHRRLRQWNIEHTECIQVLYAETQERATAAAIEAIQNGEYISIEKLKSMTISELAKFLEDAE